MSFLTQKKLEEAIDGSDVEIFNCQDFPDGWDLSDKLKCSEIEDQISVSSEVDTEEEEPEI